MEQTKWHGRRWIALGFLTLSLLVLALDNTVLNLALPSISKELGATASGLQWIVDTYVLVFASLLLSAGSIGDRVGRKRMLQAGLIVFGCFSLAAALSNSTGMLIGMRAVMGLGAAMIMPSTLSILTATFRDAKERARAIALWSATFALGVGIGPLVGGWLLGHFSWSSVFYINLPIVVVSLIGGYFFIQDSKDEHPRRIDVPGSILSIAGLSALVYGLIEAGVDGWGAQHVLYAFGAAVVLLGIFAYWEWRSPHAMLPISFFKNMSFTGANIALTLIAFAMMGSMFFMSQYLQTVQGYSPLQAGVRMLPMAAMSFVAAILSARVAQRIGTKFAVALGILLSAGGLFYLAEVATVTTTYPVVALGMCITACGMGFTMSPATNSIMGSIPVGKAGVGSAMNDTTRQVGAALGVAVLGTLLNRVYISKIDALRQSISLPDQVFGMIRNSIQGAHMAAQQISDPNLSQTIINKANDAFISGMTHALVIASIVMLVASIAALIVLPSQVRAAKEEVHAPGLPGIAESKSPSAVPELAAEDAEEREARPRNK
ncbi:MAG: MFS transporter [Chloroflexi bacterium]|nr:MFS transporter [Chloroflexota bacterium]